MIWHWQRIIRLALVAVIVISISCAENESRNGKAKQKHYSVFLGEFKKQDKIEEFRSSLNPVVWDELRIEKIYDRNYKLFYGKYSSSFEAGKTAYELLTNSIISSYKITRDGRPTLDEYANILFVSRYLDRPSIFSFNLITKQTAVDWSYSGKKIVALNHSSDHNSVFFTTASSYGKQGGMRYIHDAKIFLMKREEEQISEVGALGNGMQLYTFWENKDTFKVNFSFIDSVDSRIVNQEIIPFDLNGKPGEIKKRNFDLIQTGFPAPPKRFPIEISPNNRFRFREVYSQGESYIYLRDFDEKSEQLTVSTKRKIKDGRWSDDGNYLFIITDPAVAGSAKQKSEPTGELFIIDAVEKKLVRIFSGFRYENLLVHGKLLFFDERSNQIARIKVYDCKRDKIIHTISTFGGCGLNNLPM